MRTLFLIIISCCFFTASYGRIGLAESAFGTPGGHTICHCDPYPGEMLPILVGWDSLARLEKWYFYDNNIIGKGDVYWFIFDEGEESLQYFTNEDEWKNAIEDHGLDPLIYTKWNTMSNTVDSFGMFFATVILIPVMAAIFLFLLYLSVSKAITWNERNKRLAAGVILFIILLVWTQMNQDSF